MTAGKRGYRRTAILPTDVEIAVGDDILISRTDSKGRIVQANEAFCRISGYSEDELIGRQHSIVRHPDMPRCLFKIIWRQVMAGEDVFWHGKNMTRAGDFYWVFAHITPIRDLGGTILGYRSFRRAPPDRAYVEDVVAPVLADLRRQELASGQDLRGTGVLKPLLDLFRHDRERGEPLVARL